MTDRKNTHIVVIGAGIVGVSVAIHLQRRGIGVTLIDRDAPGEGASFGNAGVLAACSMLPVPVPGLLAKVPAMLVNPNSPLFLRWRYLPKLLPWLLPYLRNATASRVAPIIAGIANIVTDTVAEHQQLAKGTGAERWLKSHDYVFIYRRRADIRADAYARATRAAHGFEATEIDRDDLLDLAPGLGPDYTAGLHYTNHGFCTDPGAYVKDLARHFVAQGGLLERAEVTAINAQSTPVEVVAQGRTFTGDQVVIAAGAYSARLAAMVGARFPLEAERGYHVEFEAPNRQPKVPMMVTDRKLVVAPMAGRLRLAGLAEFGGLEAGQSAAPIRLIRKVATDIFPDLKFEKATPWLGSRPTTTDCLPVIGARASQPNVSYAFGHHHIGLTAGPKTGRMLAALIAGEPLNMDVAPYHPDRFN
ncbi:MAG: NAD(P)/FAD-dependent oxidoreductase [Alphaproteobacteria bacterium]